MTKYRTKKIIRDNILLPQIQNVQDRENRKLCNFFLTPIGPIKDKAVLLDL